MRDRTQLRLLAIVAGLGLLVTTASLGMAAEKADADAVKPAADAPAAQPAKEAEKAPAEAGTAPVGQECSAFENFIHESKQPFPWLKWGADLRLREIYIGNGVLLNKENPNHERHFQRYRGRWWFTASPHEDIDLNMRITWEGRHWNKPDAVGEWGGGWRGDVLFDNLNVEWRKIGGSPVTIKVGRQDIIYGDGFLVLDGTPLDGSRTIFFDAAKMSVDLEQVKTKVDLIYIEQKADPDNSWIGLIKDRGPGAIGSVIEQDEQGVILYVTNKSLPNTQVEAYFMMKEEDFGFRAGGREGEIYTFGGALSGPIADRWKYRAEGANQFGHENGRTVRAFGFNSRLTYLLKDRTDGQLHGMYEFLSGDDPSTAGTDEAFDLLWSRWPRWSELYIYAYAAETRIAEATNLHRLGFGYSCDPAKNLHFCAYYHLLFAHQNTLGGAPGFSKSNNFRGQLLTLLGKYKINDHVSTHLITEFFFPGDYYDSTRNDAAAFLRGEIVFTW